MLGSGGVDKLFERVRNAATYAHGTVAGMPTLGHKDVPGRAFFKLLKNKAK
jgi:hypothetical protein